jgi:hypothetical protein
MAIVRQHRPAPRPLAGAAGRVTLDLLIGYPLDPLAESSGNTVARFQVWPNGYKSGLLGIVATLLTSGHPSAV